MSLESLRAQHVCKKHILIRARLLRFPIETRLPWRPHRTMRAYRAEAIGGPDSALVRLSRIAASRMVVYMCLPGTLD